MSDTKLETMKLEDICCACLSFERKLSPLNYTVDGVNNLFSLLSHNSEPQQATLDAQLTQLSICWECGAVLRRLCGFRRQVCYARRQLMLLLDNEHDIDKNRECLSKLSYNYKRSFDKELVYSDVHNKNDASDDEPGVYIRGDWEPKVNDVKTETENKELNQDENTLSDFNYNDNTVKEENTTKESFAVKQNNTIKKQLKSCVTKQEVEIQDGGGDDDYITVEIESEPKRSVAKRKIKDTAKRKTGAKVKRNNLKTVKNELEEENKKVTEQNVPTAPKTRRPRKVQNRSQDPEYPCADCDQVFTTYTRRYEHIMKYHKEGYQCSACGKRFHIKKSFLRHEQVHIAKTLPREKCPTCDAMVRCDLVAEHARRHASTDAAEYACAPCNKRFANRNSYKKHMTEAKAHLADLEKKYECETCHKWFPTLLLYNCHMRYTKRHAVRAAVYRYKCAMCDKSVRSPAALRDHVHYVHMGKTSHKCAVCDKALASPQCVARHMKLFHGGYKYPKNKLCDTCGKAFSSKKDLREHESVHTGDRPLKCDVCGDTFRQSGALYTHKRRVHKVPLKPSVELVTEPDETVERLIQDCELTETDLVINRVINLKRD